MCPFNITNVAYMCLAVILRHFSRVLSSPNAMFIFFYVQKFALGVIPGSLVAKVSAMLTIY